ncbi:MAG TPA: lactate utilization protein [Candidatus Binataceae bacterium]|nr:lactate utilization protein [Candidatus Binataceae bacterium]
MAGFHKIIANLRAALEHNPPAAAVHDGVARASLPVAADARRAELLSRFASELERVNGHFIGTLSAADVCERIVTLAREMDARAVAVGDGVMIDMAPIAKALEGAGLELIRTSRTSDAERPAIRDQLAKCDLAVVEAHYAISSTGTLVMLATPGSPGSLTLLPPANIIVVDAERVLPDMAAVVGALGTAAITAHRIAFITGPSRTADIEKMIVLGVHGPKELYAAAVWRNGAAPR